MPIIRFCTNEAGVPAGVTPTVYRNFQPGTDVWTWETHVGLCLSERETNYHDDSDFYMTVWNEERQEVEEVMFATTRGWCYPAMASRPDASPEIQAKATAYWAAKRAEGDKARKEEKDAALAQLQAATGLTEAQVTRLLDVCGGSLWKPKSVLEMVGVTGGFGPLGVLLTSKLRSEFRKALKAQVIAWAQDPAPKYRTPLSPRQMEFL